MATGGATKEPLEGYVKVGAVPVPRLVFASVISTILVVYFGLMAYASPSYLPLLSASSLALVAVVWYERARAWRRLASWK